MRIAEPDDKAKFRAEVREFLSESLTDELKRAARLTTGAHSHIKASMDWYQILYRKGWVAPTWPEIVALGQA